MADIEISYDNRQVLQAKRDIQDLEKSFNSAYKSAQVFEAAFARTEKMNSYIASLNEVAAANQNIINQNLGVTNSYKSAEDSAASFTEVLRNQEAQARKFTDAFNERAGITGYYKSAAESAEIFEAAAKKESEAWFAQQRRRLAMMRESERIAEIQAFATDRSAGAFGRFGFAAQQAGYQVGDFFVQIQSGTNPLVAFGQQATQLAGLLTLSLNPAVMAWGVALSIAVPLLTAIGAAWMRSNVDGKESNKILEEQTQQYDNLVKKLREYNREKEAERRGLSVEQLTSVTQIEDASEKLLEAKKNLDDLQARFESLKGTVGGGQIASAAAISEFVKSLFGNDAQSQIEEARKKYEEALQTFNELQAKNREEATKTADEMIKQLQDQNDLNTAIKAFGEDSKTVAAIRLSQEKEVFEQKVKSLKLSDAEAQNLIRLWELANNYSEVLAGSSGEVSKQVQEQIDKQQKAADRAIYMKNVFHALAGEASSVSVYVGGWAGLIDNAVEAANRMRGALGRGLPAIPGGPREGGTAAPITSPRPRNRNEMLFDEYFGPDTGSAGVGGGAPTQSALEQLQKQLNLEQELLGTSEAYQRVRQALGDDFAKTQPQVIDGLVAQIEAVEQLKKVEEDRKKIMDTVKSSLEDSFMSMVDGTKSVKDAFRDMARDIIKELYRVLVVQRMVNAISGFVSPTINSAIPMPSTAAPASVSMPKMSAPVSRSLPSANTTVVQNINISGTGDGAYVRSEISKALPQIVGATKSAVIDARRRGGQMAAAFS